MGAITKYDQETRRQNRLEKYRLHFRLHGAEFLNKKESDKLEKVELSAKDKKYLDLMEKAFAYQLTDFMSPAQVRKKIMEDGKYSYSMACQIVSDADVLFGDTDEISKPAVRKTLTELCYEAIQIARTATDKPIDQAHAILKAVDRIAKVNNLSVEDNALTSKAAMPPVSFIIQNGTITNNTMNVPPKFIPGQNGGS